LLQVGIVLLLSNESSDVCGISWKKFWPAFLGLLMMLYIGAAVFYFIDYDSKKPDNEVTYFSFIITFPFHLVYYVVQFLDIIVTKEDHLVKKDKLLKENL
jgi:hypothetical protein